MLFEEEKIQLLKPGYSSMETGYHRLPNGQMFVAALTPMPGCNGQMIDWWFGHYLRDTETFKKWDPGTICFQWDQKWKPGHYLDAESYSEMTIADKIVRHKRVYENPAHEFDVSKFQDAHIETLIYGKDYSIDGSPEGRTVHLVRGSDDGCEMRSRFWIDNGSEEIARDHFEYTLKVIPRMAEMLRTLRKQSPDPEKTRQIMCKFCHSEKVIKNGKYKNSQYWLCKECGRGFADNHCLPKMKYPPDTVATAVHHYFDGYSLGQICSDIEKNNNILPSTSTIYGWVIKLVEKATSLTVFAHPQGGARWLVYETENWFKDRRYWITYVMDIETHFLLSAVLSYKKIKTDFESLIISAEEKAGKSPEVIFTNIEEKYFKEIDCTCGLRSKHPRITSFTGQDLNSGFIHIFPNMIKNRLKLEYDTEVSDRYKKILNGFIFHHNFIYLPAGINRTPADIAKIEFPIKGWLDVIKKP